MYSRNIGASIPRLEDPSILMGRGRFVGDIRIPEMLQAAFVRSRHAHAYIRGIDTTKASALRGVHAVLTLQDLSAAPHKRMVQSNPHPLLRQNITQLPLVSSEVCY